MRRHLDTTEKVHANFRERHGENMSADEWAANFVTFMDSSFWDFWNCVFGGDYTNPELREFMRVVSIDVIYDEIAKTGAGRLFVASRFQKRSQTPCKESSSNIVLLIPNSVLTPLRGHGLTPNSVVTPLRRHGLTPDSVVTPLRSQTPCQESSSKLQGVKLHARSHTPCQKSSFRWH